MIKEYKWGRMRKIDIGGLLQGSFEMIHFSAMGSPHTHRTAEIACCCTGSGKILVKKPSGYQEIAVKAFDFTEIPGGLAHYMVADPGQEEIFSFWIGYRVE